MKLLLAGAGYAHLLLLRDWHKHAASGLELTLVSPSTRVPYSGMLPACIAGDYSSADIHIDLPRLCQQAGATLVQDEITGLEPAEKQVLLRSRRPLGYDLLSLNTGPAADTSIPGVAEHAIAVKPISNFLPHWQACKSTLQRAEQVLRLVMVGGGAGSVETIIAMAQAVQQDSTISHKPRFTLLAGASRILPDYPERVARVALARCEALGIEVLSGRQVSRVETSGLFLQDSFNQLIPFDLLFWCTGAAAPAWLAASGLACTEAGFLKVNANLQSLSDPGIFAAGDVAAFAPALPKAGVFSVRQAPILRRNLQLAAQGKALKPYKPQARFLSLLNLDAELAAGCYGPLSFSGAWVRRWKNRIDQHFMDSFGKKGSEPN